MTRQFALPKGTPAAEDVPTPAHRRIPVWILIFLTGLVAGCSSFSREWKAADRPATDPLGIEGRWIGTWQNTNNTHADKTRAVMTRTGDGVYDVHFHAKYKTVLGFKYRATFRGTAENGAFVFRGEEDLGVLAGGLYRYAGKVSPTNFYSTYESKYDTGTFTLRRP